MRALLLCGGFATRLEPITYFMPKHLLPIGVGGKPIIEFILDDLLASGVKDIVLSTNVKFAHQFEYWLRNRLKGNPDVSFKIITEKTVNNNEKFGAIKGIAYAIEQAGINEDTIIIAADNLYDFSVKDVIDAFNTHRKPTIAVYDIDSHDDARRFGVVSVDGDHVRSFVEKPKEPPSTLISTGIYVFPKESLGRFNEYLNDLKNPDSVGYFVEHLVNRDDVRAHVYKGKWYDIGTLDTYKKVFDEFSQKIIRERKD